MLINILMRTLQCIKSSIFFMKIGKKYFKKYKTKIAGILNIALTAAFAPQKRRRIRLILEFLGYITLGKAPISKPQRIKNITF